MPQHAEFNRLPTQSGRTYAWRCAASLGTPLAAAINARTRASRLKSGWVSIQSLAGCVPSAIVSPEGIAAAECLGSHTFRLSSLAPGKATTLTRVDAATVSDALGAPLTEIEFRVVPSKPEQVAMLVRGELDFVDQLGALERNHLAGGKLSEPLIAARVRASFVLEPEVIYYYLTPTEQHGGNTPAGRALRHAVLQSYPVASEIASVRGGLGVPPVALVPPQFPDQESGSPPIGLDPATANALLDEHGFKRGVDGWRRWPNGEPIEFVFTSEPLAGVEPYRELRRASLAALGLRMNSALDSYRNNVAAAQACRAPFWGASWTAMLPTPGYVLSVLRSDNNGTANLTCYRNPEFDRLHTEAQQTPSGAARAELYRDLQALVHRDAIWHMGVRRQRAALYGPRLSGFRAHAMLPAPWATMRIVAGDARYSQELTYLKANEGQRDALATFILNNWFEMDRIAQQRGLIAQYELLESAPQNTNTHDWDLLVRVRYPQPNAYAGIASEFEIIRKAHQTVLVDGKALRD